MEKMTNTAQGPVTVVHPTEYDSSSVIDPYFSLTILNPRHRIFLAGPCPRKDYDDDWRVEAVKYLEEAGYEGVVFSPTNRNFDKADPFYLEKQTRWELSAMGVSELVVFWIPRDEKNPALTTNIELGEFLNKDNAYRMLIGMPDWGEKNDYIKIRLGLLRKQYDNDLRTLMYRAVKELSRW